LEVVKYGTGQYTCNWNFDAEGMMGFQAMGADLYFSAMP
jgi:hypothetical protein